MTAFFIFAASLRGHNKRYFFFFIWQSSHQIDCRSFLGFVIQISNTIMLQYFSQGKGVESARYTSEDFLFRWKKLQRIVQKQGLDGLLLIAGLDGGQHVSTSYLINWLLLGLSGKQIYNNRFLDPKYSELIVYVSTKESYIFLPPEAKKDLEYLVYALQNCTVFAPTDQEFNNRDKFQILKIASFYQAVSKASKIGFFLESEQQPKSIQKWPIIQSFALQPVGRTFFTLKYQAVNLHSKITPLFRNFDKHSLRQLYDRNAYSLEGQVGGSTQCIQYTPLQNRSAISQLQLQQALFQAADITGQGTTQRPVRVLFGARTNSNEKSSKEVTVANAFHFIVEHFDPLTQLQVWRTYFLQSNIRNNWDIKMIEQQSSQTFLITKKYLINRSQNVEYNKRWTLLNSYISLVQGVLDGIATVSRDYRNLTKQFLSNHIVGKINSILSASGVGINKDQLEVFLQSFDSFGEPRPIDFKDSITFKLTSTFYVLKCRLNGIVEPHSKQNLGSVSFSQSFLLQEGCYLLLTKDTPYFDFWRTTQVDYSILQKPNPNIEFLQLGKCISTDFKGRFFIPLQKLSSCHLNLPILNVKFYFHQKGLRLYHQKIGWHILLYSTIENAAMINKISGQWVLFQTNSSLIFEGLQSKSLALQFRGKAFEELLKKVNDKANPLPLSFLDIIPSILGENWYFTKQILKKEVREGALIHQYQILQRQFLWAFIEAKQLMVLNQMKDIKLASFKSLYQQKLQRKNQELPPTQKPSIIVINGTYASGKLKLAQTLSKFGSNDKKYSIFNIPAQNLYAKMELSTFLQMLKEHISQTQASDKNLFIVVLPSWINSAQALPQLAQQYHLRSVLCKINASNFFSSIHRQLTENALTFAIPGFSQTIVLDSQGEDENLLVSITRILWNFAKESRITRASNSVLSTGQCNDILKDNSYNTEYQKFLRNKYGALYRFDHLAQLTLSFIEFKFPILDIPALKALSLDQGFLIDRAAIQQELRPQKIQAENSKDQLMEGLFKLQEVMTIQRKREKAPQIRSLKGIVQLQNDEKAEILWANNIFKERVVSNTNQNLGLCVLAKNYDSFQVKEFLLKLTYRKFILSNLKPLINESSLSQEDRTAISRGGKDKYLTQGDFYDGYFYRDIQGHILPEHPKLKLLIEEWINERNRQVQGRNNEVRRQWQNYCKQYE